MSDDVMHRRRCMRAGNSGVSQTGKFVLRKGFLPCAL